MTVVRSVLMTALVAACGAPAAEPTQHLPKTETPNLTLYVSNQSFDKATVDIRVRIDDQLAITGDFAVEGQHSWHAFDLELADGAHVLEVASRDSSATLEVPFTLTGRKYGVVDFWYDEDNVELPEHFGWFMTNEPPMFD